MIQNQTKRVKYLKIFSILLLILSFKTSYAWVVYSEPYNNETQDNPHVYYPTGNIVFGENGNPESSNNFLVTEEFNKIRISLPVADSLNCYNLNLHMFDYQEIRVINGIQGVPVGTNTGFCDFTTPTDLPASLYNRLYFIRNGNVPIKSSQSNNGQSWTGQPNETVRGGFAFIMYHDILEENPNDSTIAYDFNDTPPAIDPSTPNWEAETCDVLHIGGCLRNALNWAIDAPEESFTQFNDIKEILKTKAPIGYAFLVYDMLGNLQTDTNNDQYTVESITGIDDNIFSPIRNGLIWLLPVSFLFGLFIRFKDINI